MKNQPKIALIIEGRIYLYSDPVLAMIHVVQSGTDQIYTLDKSMAISYSPITKEALRASISKE